MSALIQISDPHFGTERPAVVDALVRFVADQAPEVVVMSGDITQRATEHQFDAARAFADRLAVPALLAIPGNHDIPLFDLKARLFRPYARYRAAFGTDLEPVLRSPSWCVVGVRTTRRWRHSNGQVSFGQVTTVADRLRTAETGQMRIVVVHQPVAVPDGDEADSLLRGRDRAIGRWAAAGADVVLGGHLHLPYVIPLHERQPDLPRRLWCVQAGTAVSARVRHDAPNSVNVLRHAARDAGLPRRAVVERWDYDAAAERFVMAGEETLMLSDAPDG